jgi:hypothetical protein
MTAREFLEELYWEQRELLNEERFLSRETEKEEE